MDEILKVWEEGLADELSFEPIVALGRGGLVDKGAIAEVVEEAMTEDKMVVVEDEAVAVVDEVAVVVDE
ncbi:hypothetical protein KI387_030444, partial [Taxus chinensis]